MDINESSRECIDAAMRVHTQLGPGWLESAYQACLEYELRKRGLTVATQVGLPVVYEKVRVDVGYEKVRVDVGYRLDLVVEDDLVIELKAVDAIHPIHKAQLLPYLRLRGKKVGLIINFNVPHLKDGITRMVNGL